MMTAFRNAAMNGHNETVKLLLDRGADIHANDNDALRKAAQYGHPDTVKVLLIEERIFMLGMMRRFVMQHIMDIPKQ